MVGPRGEVDFFVWVFLIIVKLFGNGAGGGQDFIFIVILGELGYVTVTVGAQGVAHEFAVFLGGARVLE